MKIIKTTTLAVALGVVAAFQTAQASLISTDPVTLASLTGQNGGSISIGDKTFSGFYYSATGNLGGFDASQIMVTATIDDAGVYFLNWTGLIQTTSSGDLLLQYVVTASAGMISMIDQSYTGGGILRIDETVATGSFGGPVAAQSHLTGTFNSEFTGPNLYVNPAQTTLYVTKDIALATSDTVDLSSISRVSQSFHQTAVPEPSTVVAGALLLLPFGVSTLRILRKNKAS